MLDNRVRRGSARRRLRGRAPFEERMPDGPYNIAASYYGRYRPRYPVELIDFIIRWASDHDEYLDLGCGTGALLFAVAPHFRRAVGVDVDRTMLQEATASQPEVEGKNVVLIEQKAEDYLARRRTSLDLVTAGRSTMVRSISLGVPAAKYSKKSHWPYRSATRVEATTEDQRKQRWSRIQSGASSSD